MTRFLLRATREEQIDILLVMSDWLLEHDLPNEAHVLQEASKCMVEAPHIATDLYEALKIVEIAAICLEFRIPKSLFEGSKGDSNYSSLRD